MKKTFHPNRKWINISAFLLVNSLASFILLFLLGITVDDLPNWIPYLLPGIIILSLFYFFREWSLIPQKVEIEDKTLTFSFLFAGVKSYEMDEVVCYATAIYGSGRSLFCHAIILEFNDQRRIAIPAIKIENYPVFLEFIKTSSIEFFGFIGQNNWRRVHKPLSKKWAIPRIEKQFEDAIGKTKNYFVFYFIGFLLLLMNATILYLFIFKFSTLN